MFQIEAHRAVLDGQPSDRSAAVARTEQELARARNRQSNRHSIVAGTRERLDVIGALSGLSRHGLAERRWWRAKLVDDLDAAELAWAATETTVTKCEQLQCEQAAHDRFERTHRWRREEVAALRSSLDRHWADVVAGCVGPRIPSRTASTSCAAPARRTLRGPGVEPAASTSMLSGRPEVMAKGLPGRTFSLMAIKIRLDFAGEMAPRVPAGGGVGDRTRGPSSEMDGVLLRECSHSLGPGAVQGGRQRRKVFRSARRGTGELGRERGGVAGVR